MDVVALLFLYFVTFFIVGTFIKNNAIVDIGWGLGFVLIAWLRQLTEPTGSPAQIAITLLVTVWGLRLSYHIWRRNRGKPEDFRYARWREEWGRWAVPRAFFQVYMLQGLFMYIVALPIIAVSQADAQTNVALLIGGIAVWVFGFVFEAVGDWQLKQFLSHSENRGKLMTSGLWQYTRHPNYFGEAVMWWGIYVIALSAGGFWWAILSPIMITFLLRYVSGVPLLEESMRKKPGFEAYARRTSIFVPWFPRDSADHNGG